MFVRLQDTDCPVEELFVLGILRVETFDPRGNGRNHGLRLGRLQQPPDLIPLPPLRAAEFFQQLGRAETLQIGERAQRSILCGHPPDPAMFLVSIRMPIGGLIVADDRVVPIGHVECAIGPNSHIDGAKATVIRNDQRGKFL